MSTERKPRCYVVCPHRLFNHWVHRQRELGFNAREYIHMNHPQRMRGIQLLPGEVIEVPFGLHHLSRWDHDEMREIINYKRETQTRE